MLLLILAFSDDLIFRHCKEADFLLVFFWYQIISNYLLLMMKMMMMLMQLSWSKSLVLKWFNIRGKSYDFHGDDAAAAFGRRGE